MSRIEDPYLIEMLRGIERDMDEFKAAQAVAGDSLLGYLVGTTAPNDYQFAIAGGQIRRFLLEYAFAAGTNGAVVELANFYSIDNPNVVLAAYPPWANGPPVAMLTQPLPPTNTTSRWHLDFYSVGSDPHNIYLKFIFSGTAPGAWTLTPV